jgi:hypothetical protein
LPSELTAAANWKGLAAVLLLLADLLLLLVTHCLHSTAAARHRDRELVLKRLSMIIATRLGHA